MVVRVSVSWERGGVVVVAPCVVFLQYSNGPWFVACLSCGRVMQMDEQAGVNGAATGGPTSGIPYVPVTVTVTHPVAASGSSLFPRFFLLPRM